MSERSLEGHYRGTPTAEDAFRVHALLARLVVPPSEFHVPLRLNPDAWGAELHPRRLSEALTRGSTIEDGWSPAWERLEAQVALCVASGDIAAGAGYALRMLDARPYSRDSLHWEGYPGSSRLWVRRGLWMTPLPLQSATEGVLWSWWALSGGFHNFDGRLLPFPDYPLETFPHYDPEDVEALAKHPSRVTWQQSIWVGPRQGEDLSEVFGVLYDSHGVAVRPTNYGPRPFDWREYPEVTYGLDWLSAATHHLGEPLFRLAWEWRLEMQPPQRGN